MNSKEKNGKTKATNKEQKNPTIPSVQTKILKKTKEKTRRKHQQTNHQQNRRPQQKHRKLAPIKNR